MAGQDRQSAGEIGEEGAPANLTPAGILRLLGSGAGGMILLALGDGPLRTKELTEEVPGYAPRTVYRYANKLVAAGAIEREEEPGVPSKVLYRLSNPRGTDLHDLMTKYGSSIFGVPGGAEMEASAWRSVALLGDLWDSGLLDELNQGPKSPTELARAERGLSFHQVNRRAGLLARAGLIEEVSEARTRRSYALTEKARRAMALVAAVGRWRRHHVVPEGETGLSSAEVARLMRTILPLVTLPDHHGKGIELRIAETSREELIWAGIQPDGLVISRSGPLEVVDGRMHGEVTAWVDWVLDGPHEGLEMEGDTRLLAECLQQLHLE